MSTQDKTSQTQTTVQWLPVGKGEEGVAKDKGGQIQGWAKVDLQLFIWQRHAGYNDNNKRKNCFAYSQL